MHILILGGTVFIGRYCAQRALERGHQVTVFNRGQSNAGVLPGAEHLHGDRLTNDVCRLGERKWDAVIDTCGYTAASVKASVETLSSQTPHYVFVSSLGVYADRHAANLDEQDQLVLDDVEIAEFLLSSTEPKRALDGMKQKVLCEKVVETSMPNSSLILRLGLIVGPGDPTDRFTYWVVRGSQGGSILAPAPMDGKIQFLDVRDLAEFVISLVERGEVGVLNLAGPSQPFTFEELLATCTNGHANQSSITWVSEEFLLATSVRMYSDLPLWFPQRYAGLNQRRIDRALEAGLKHRPVAETVRDTFRWHQARSSSYVLRAGLSLERELDLLQRWTLQSPEKT